MLPVILAGVWLAVMGAVVSQEVVDVPETLYKVEECDCNGVCQTVLEVKETP